MAGPSIVITSAGEADAIAAGINGPWITVDRMRLGDASGYTAARSDVALHGTPLFTGLRSAGSYIGNNTWRALYLVPASVVATYGELGIYTLDGVLLGLAAWPTPQVKNITQVLEFRCDIVLSSQFVTKIDNQFAFRRAMLVDSYGIEQIDANGTVEGNWHLTHTYAENGRLPTTLTNKDGTVWDLPSHPIPIATGLTTIAGSTTTVVHTGADLTGAIRTTPTGKYVVQFTSGALAGQLRMVDTVTSTTITLHTALPATPGIGDSFDVAQSITSRIQEREVIPGFVAGGTVNLYDDHMVIVVDSGASDTTFPNLSTLPSVYSVTIFNNTGANINVLRFTGQTFIVGGNNAATTVVVRGHGGALEFVKKSSTVWSILQYEKDWVIVP